MRNSELKANNSKLVQLLSVLLVASVFVSTLFTGIYSRAVAAESSTSGGNNSAQTATEIDFDMAARVPVIEANVGRATMPVGGENNVSLPGIDGASAALIRLSVFDAVDNTVVTVGGTPALQAAKGADASQAVLAKVVNGKVSLGASTDSMVRVELLATFNEAELPGSTIALDQPVTRVNTNELSGIDSLTTSPQAVGLTGLGGVPANDVRAIWATLTVTSTTAGTLTFGGQELAIPVGTSSTTTIVAVDNTGSVNISADHNLTNATLRVDVRGYVLGNAQFDEDSNVSGSYVPTENVTWASATASENIAESVELPAQDGALYGIALVQAKVAGDATSARTFVDVGEEILGRSSGVVVDDKVGAAAQLEIIENPSTQATVSLRGDTSNVQVLLLGNIVGDSFSTRGTVSVAFTSPVANATIDYREHAGVTLTGTVTSDAPIEYVEVFGDDQRIGTASVWYNETGVGQWQIECGSPYTGQVTYRVRAVAKDGAEASATRNLQVILPDADDIIVNPNATVVAYGDDSPVVSLTNTTFVLNEKPDFTVGAIAVTGISDSTPEGFLRKVEAIQKQGDTWEITGTTATLTDLFYQLDFEQVEEIYGNETITETNGASDSQLIVLDGDKESVTVEQETEATERSTENTSGNNPSLLSMPQALATTGSRDWVSQDPADQEMSVDLVNIDKKWSIDKNWSKEVSSSNAKATTVDYSKVSDAEAKALSKKFSAEGKLQVALKAKLTVGLLFGIKINSIWGWFFGDAIISYAKLEAFAKASATVGAEATVKGSFDNTIELFDAEKSINFAIATIPVVITNKFTVNAVPSITVEGKASWQFEAEAKAQAGVVLTEENDDFTEYMNLQGTDLNDGICGTELEASVGVEAKVGLAVSDTVKLYDAIGGTLTVTPALGATGELKSNVSDGLKGSFEIYTEVASKLDFVVEIPVIDVNLGKVTHEFDKITTTLLKGENTFIEFCSSDSDSDSGSDSGSSSGGSDSTDTSYPSSVLLTWIDPVSGAHATQSLKLKNQVEITQNYVERQLGLSSGSLDEMKGVSTLPDGQGTVYRLGSYFQAIHESATLYVFYDDPEMPEFNVSAADVVFVIDSTASMTEEISAVKTNVSALADALSAAIDDYRMAVVDYKDVGDEHPYMSSVKVPFTQDIDSFKDGVNGITLTGGRTTAECMYSGLMTAIGDLEWRSGTRKLIFLIGDEPGLDPEPVTGYTGDIVISAANALGAQIYPLGRVASYTRALSTLASSEHSVQTYASNDFASFTSVLAQATGGVYTEYTNQDFAERLLNVVTEAAVAPEVSIGLNNIFHTGETVQLSAAVATQSENPVVSYDWNFGTGTPYGEYDVSTTDGYVETVFDTPGTYIVTVRAMTQKGISGVGTLTIDVSDQVPATAFSASTSATKGETVILQVPVLPGTDVYDSLTFDNGESTKVVPGEGTWEIALDGDTIVVTFTPATDYSGSTPTSQLYTLTDVTGVAVNGWITVTYE